MKFLTQRAWHHAVRGTGSRYVFERGFTHSSHLRTHATGTDARNAPDAGEEPRTDTGRSKEATYALWLPLFCATSGTCGSMHGSWL